MRAPRVCQPRSSRPAVALRATARQAGGTANREPALSSTSVSLPRIRRKKSPLHGLGVFAARTDPQEHAHHRLCRRARTAQRRAPAARSDAPWPQGCIWVVRVNRALEPRRGHRRQHRPVHQPCLHGPTAGSEIVDKTIWIRASRRIEPGWEELTYDYCHGRRPHDPSAAAGRAARRACSNCPEESPWKVTDALVVRAASSEPPSPRSSRLAAPPTAPARGPVPGRARRQPAVAVPSSRSRSRRTARSPAASRSPGSPLTRRRSGR